MDSVDIEVLRSVVSWRRDDHAVALFVVVETWGSSPRPVGAIAAVRGDGMLVGSVSGGCVEDDLIARVRAGEFLSRLPQFITYGVTREQTESFGLPCGGTLRLLVEPISNTQTHEAVLRSVKRRVLVARCLDLQRGTATIIPAKPGDELAVNAMTVRTIHGPRWRLLIIGAGDVSRYLAQMAQTLDYQVLVCDPRADLVATWNMPGVKHIPGMPDDVVQELAPDCRTAIVALTHDPKLDDLALLEALKSNAFYVGAIGSERNNTKRRARLAEYFALTSAELARLHGPIGLPIRSQAPPEIAVAIIAELTALRNGVRLTAADSFATIGQPHPVCVP
ncbi:MAG TPA: XdhC family protein [Gammaproteobacteria bacterium]|nr:XdhC family protein [Gammaproteobacteria bacterium]